jgi:serine/threonine-protein phosphatase 2B catalytic subunit
MDDLKDPKKDRVAKQLPSPPQRPLASHVLFKQNNEVDWQTLRDHLRREGRIAANDVLKLLDLVSFIVSIRP